jgi:hypothetical protein
MEVKGELLCAAVANGLSRMSSNGDISSERNRRSMTASHFAAIASAFAIICQVVPASPQDPRMRLAASTG